MAALGAFAGLVGGLAGIGGSLIMLPGLGVLIGYSDKTANEQHLYAAAAMVVNLLVSVSATRQHLRRGAVRADIVRILIPTLGVALLIGVLLSNRFQGRILAIGLAIFVAAFAVQCLVLAARGSKAKDNSADPPEPEMKPRPWGVGVVGAVAGSVGGMLGLGGGAIMVPGLQVVARAPLRTSIAASAMAMCATSGFGAVLKISTLYTKSLSWVDALILAAAMGLPAMMLAKQGAKLAHVLPLHWIRACIGVVLLVASARLAGVI